MIVAADDVIRLRGSRAFEDAIVGRVNALGETRNLPLRFRNFLFRPPELDQASK